jgi:predicted ATPase
MLIFEDLHWIDGETQVFLNLLAEGIANAPILLLVNYRPEYSHQWGSKTYYTQLRLDPLGKESAEQMLSALVGDGAELAALKRLIVDKTEGNPLFMEEIFQALLEDGSLQRNGSVKLVRPVEQLRLPPTVQGILAARIDRLPREEKELLRTLAVIGTESPFTLVREVVQLPSEHLDRLMSVLQTGEFIYEQPAAGDVEYSFKHALTHDVAYNSLLAERRRLLHERTARAIEAMFLERLDDRYSELAHHYRLSNNAAKAIEYLCLAGEQIACCGAYAQALENVEPALALIERLAEEDRPRAELGVRLMQGMCVPGLYGISSEERRRTFQRVCEMSEQLGDASALLRGLLNVAGAELSGGEARRALETCRRCVELAEEGSDPATLSAALLQLAGATRLSGDPVQAASLCGEVIRRAGSANHQASVELLPLNIWPEAVAMLAATRLLLGYPDDALELSDEALQRARELKHPFTLAAIGIAASLAVRYWRRQPEAVRLAANALISLAECLGFIDFVAIGRTLRGWALAQNNQTESGLAEVVANSALVPGIWRIEVNAILAEVQIKVGLFDQALEVLGNSLARVEGSGARVYECELHRLKGEAIRLRDHSATPEAEACFRRAIETARGQSAKWWELRATISLARLLRDPGRRDEARTMLAEIYNWFTEGFDTADLKEAKALLGELNG